MVQKIIIDTDIGDDIDDIFALLLALLSKKIDILGVTTCFRDTKKRAKIAKALLTSVNKDIEVYMGDGSPINNEVVYADFDRFDNNGEVIVPQYFEGMESYEINEKPAVDFILESIKKYPDEITLVSIGPMTNLARAFEKSPETFRKAKLVLFMGGQIESKFKEWNIRCDVEAASIVFSANVPMKMVGLDMTSQCKLSKEQVAHILNLDDKGYRPLLKKALKAYLDYFDGNRLPVMHDPLTIACLLGDFCQFKKHKVEVVTEGEGRGRTVVNPTLTNNAIEVAYRVDVEGFHNYLFKCLDD